jgi:hypothetical protein
MPDIQITDQLDRPVTAVKIDLARPSSLVTYLKTEALHLAVVPDFLERKDKILTQAATSPIRFQASAKHEFQLGNTTPEISIEPGAQVTISVNATPGSDLFDSEPFHLPAMVPDHTGYVGIGFEGSLDLGVSGSDGDLTFGFDKAGTVGLDYHKAFPLGGGEPTLVDALSRTLAAFVIPADLSDLDSLGTDDIATVSGKGSLKVSGGVSVSVSPNPLASVDLPFGAGPIAVKAGATAGLSASFTLSGTYQIRVRRMNAATIELSVLQARGTALKADFSASAGVTAKVGDTDLVAAVLEAISTDPAADQKLLADLKPAELSTLADAFKRGLNHSVEASVNLVLTSLRDDQAAFQYEIQPGRLSPEASEAVHKALDGDFRLLTAMEESAQDDGSIVPGIRVLNSVLTATRKHGATFKLNLLGIVNLISLGQLIRNSEILHDFVKGDVTIRETITGQRITAIMEPLARGEALRKAMFDSVLVTTTYRAGRALIATDLACEHMHFAANQNTNGQIVSDYLGWFVALNLLTKQEKADTLAQFTDGGASSCVLRTAFDDRACVALFLDGNTPRSEKYYLDIGRQALRALLDPDHQAIDRLRYRMLDDGVWPKALETGTNPNLGPLVGLSTGDLRVNVLSGDLGVITDWAAAMVAVGALVRDMRAYVGDTGNPDMLLHDNKFKQKREALQKKLASVVKAGKTRFDEPWGMVSLFRAAGSPQTAYAKTTTQHLTVERRAQPAIAAARG